jgi:hypothetical protein
VVLSQAQVKSQNEPTNAAEAAAKKAADDKALDDQYQAWKAKLPADQQAWETVLEQNLGNGFYLPLHKKDKSRAAPTPGISSKMIPSCRECC